MEKQTVYIPVSKITDFTISEKHSESFFAEKKENMVVLTEQEYQKEIDAAILLGRTLEMDFSKYSKEDIGDAFEKGWRRGHADGADILDITSYDDKEQYLNNLK